MSWQPEVDEIKRRTELARQMGGKERIDRHHANGRLTVRERLDALLDPDSFHEVGALAGKAVYDDDGNLASFTPSNFIMGTGRIDGRRVVLGGDDFTIRGGAADGAVGSKMAYSEKLALGLRIPMVRLVDGTGGGGSVKTIEEIGRTYVPANPAWDTVIALMGQVPVVSACLGSVAGIGAVRVATSHFSVMVRGSSQLFVAGPPVVEQGVGEKVSKEELGGAHIHARESGAVDNEAPTELEAFAQVRAFLSYLPSSVWELPPVTTTEDTPARKEEDLLHSVPREKMRTFDMRKIIALVVDRNSFFEIGRYQGRTIICGLARLNGHGVGIVANNPRHGGGGLDAAGSEKLIRFVDLCDTFHLPVVNFVDNPGFLIGKAAEKQGTVRIGSRALAAIYQASVPWVSILIRRCFGVAGAGHGNAQSLNLRYAWPSGDWGSLPIEGGVMAAYRREIEAAPDPAAKRIEIEDRLRKLTSPFRTAEAFGVEEIIDPRDTRPLLCEWVETVYKLLPSTVGPKSRWCRP